VVGPELKYEAHKYGATPNQTHQPSSERFKRARDHTNGKTGEFWLVQMIQDACNGSDPSANKFTSLSLTFSQVV